MAKKKNKKQKEEELKFSKKEAGVLLVIAILLIGFVLIGSLFVKEPGDVASSQMVLNSTNNHNFQDILELSNISHSVVTMLWSAIIADVLSFILGVFLFKSEFKNSTLLTIKYEGESIVDKEKEYLDKYDAQDVIILTIDLKTKENPSKKLKDNTKYTYSAIYVKDKKDNWNLKDLVK